MGATGVARLDLSSPQFLPRLQEKICHEGQELLRRLQFPRYKESIIKKGFARV